MSPRQGPRPAFTGSPPAKPPRHPASLILWAVRTGRISARRAGWYPAEAAAGRDVSVLRDLVVPPGAEPVSAHAWDVAIQTVHNALDSINWTDSNTSQTSLVQQGDGAEAAANAEYDDARPFLFGPASAQDRERLAQASEARRQRVMDLPEDDLYSLLFHPAGDE
jgi:hypothetical protein